MSQKGLQLQVRFRPRLPPHGRQRRGDRHSTLCSLTSFSETCTDFLGGASCVCPDAGHLTVDSSAAPLAYVVNSASETPADVHGGAGGAAAVARTAALNLAAQTECYFATDAASEQAVAADESCAAGGRWASGGAN